jgi:hypothetical protein
LRPIVCRAFPADRVEGVLCVQSDTGCTCRQWTLADLDLAEEAALVAARQADAEEYCAVVARWNDRVAAAPPESPASGLHAYAEFLLDAYDAITAADPAARTEAS